MKRLDLGLSLLEVLFAVVLVVTVFLGTISGLPIIFRAQLVSEKVSVATTVGQSLLAQVRVNKFADVKSAKGIVDVSTLSAAAPKSERFDYELEVSPRGIDLKDITVTVRWAPHDANGRIVLQTLIYRPVSHPLGEIARGTS